MTTSLIIVHGGLSEGNTSNQMYLIAGPVKSRIEGTYSRIFSGLRPRTSQAYMDKLSLF